MKRFLSRRRLCLGFVTAVLLTSSGNTLSSQSTSPLHVFLYQGTGGYLLKTSSTSPGPGWVYTGVCCEVYTTQQGSTVPFKRYFNTESGVHFFTIAENPGSPFVYEGPCCFLWQTQEAGTVPLYRWNRWQTDHVVWTWTTDSSACCGWTNEGIAGYVAPH